MDAEENFSNFVNDSWFSMGNQSIMNRLKGLKNKLLGWNKGCVGNLEMKADELAKDILFLYKKKMDHLNKKII